MQEQFALQQKQTMVFNGPEDLVAKKVEYTATYTY
jgi:hypothetical protein